MGLSAWTAIFLASAALVVWAGVRLARCGESLAQAAGLSRLTVGLLFMAVATSLPEIVTDVSAVVVGSPDLAIGDLLGSSMANMAALAVIDLVHRNRVWPAVEVGHARVASIAIVLTAVAALGILEPFDPAVGWVGVETIVISLTYVAVLVWMRRSPVSRFSEVGPAPIPTGWSTRRGDLWPAVRQFVIGAGVVLVAAPLFARSGQAIAQATGISESFLGVTFLAAATSLPELVVALAAVRIGADDLAVGNLLGSNAFNMFALLFIDLAYVDGPVLGAVDRAQAISAVGAILLMALALAALVHGVETRVRRLEPDAVLVLATYGALLTLVWAVGA